MITSLLFFLFLHADSPLDHLDPKAVPAAEKPANLPADVVGILVGHTRSVASLAFSPEGGMLASSSWDGTLRLWKFGGKTVQPWAELEGSPSGVAFSPDGRFLAAGGKDALVHIWELTGREAKEKHSLAGHKSRPFALAFDPKGKYLASASFEPALRIWKWDPKEPEAWAVLVQERNLALGISSLAFSGDGALLAAGHLAGADSLRLWSAGGSFLESSEVPMTQARLTAFSSRGMLATTGLDGTIQIWDLRAGRLKKGQALGAKPGAAPVKSFAFSPDGRFLAAAYQNRRVILWSHEHGKAEKTWDWMSDTPALAFAPDGRHLAIGFGDGDIYVVRLLTSK